MFRFLKPCWRRYVGYSQPSVVVLTTWQDHYKITSIAENYGSEECQRSWFPQNKQGAKNPKRIRIWVTTHLEVSASDTSTSTPTPQSCWSCS